jgi:adenylosuccinate synthase
VVISSEAHLVLPHHRKNDEGGGFVGTTGRGIGPAYSDKARRLGIRFGDLLDEARLREGARAAASRGSRTPPRGSAGPASTSPWRRSTTSRVRRPFVRDTGALVRDALAAGAARALRGGPGDDARPRLRHLPLRDVSSHPTVGGILVGAGVSHKALHGVYGVVKAFTTRVGHGPFRPSSRARWPSGCAARGRTSGTSSAPPRADRAASAGSTCRSCATPPRSTASTASCVTKLDVLSGLDEVRVCVDVDAGGAPVYATLPGWGDLHGLGSREALPQGVLDYLSRSRRRPA